MTFEEYITPFITPSRLALIQRVAKERTNYMAVVLEDIYQAQNASAVLRSAECFGVQNVHLIENNHQYELNPKVVKGANKWLHLHRYNQFENNTALAVEALKKDNYRIVVTTPHENGASLDDFDCSRGKFALVFGSEVNGVSPEMLELADEYLTISMVGFTESLNISVAAAVVIENLARRIRASSLDWQLSQKELADLLDEWYKKSVSSVEVHIRNYNNRFSNQSL